MNLPASKDLRLLAVAAGLVIAASAIAFTIFFFESRQQRTVRQTETVAETALDPEILEAKSEGDEVSLDLYYYLPGAGSSSPSGELSAYAKTLFRSDDEMVMARQIIAEVLKGAGPGMTNPFPPESRLRQIYRLEAGTLVVDLSSETAELFRGSAQSELLALRSLSHSLTSNLEGTERVKFLIQGEERETFAGHISIRNTFM